MSLWCGSGSRRNTRKSRRWSGNKGLTSISATRLNRPSDRRPPWHESDFRSHRARPHAVHDHRQRQRQRRCLHRIPEAANQGRGARNLFDSRSRLSSSREESQRFRAHAGREIALALSASLFTGPQPRRVGVEASESRYRRPHGDDQQSRFHEEGSPLDAARYSSRRARTWFEARTSPRRRAIHNKKTKTRPVYWSCPLRAPAGNAVVWTWT